VTVILTSLPRHDVDLLNVHVACSDENGVERRKANWIGHVLHRNCLRKHVSKVEIEERIEVTRRRRRRRKSC
jgi:hypothetical protein